MTIGLVVLCLVLQVLQVFTVVMSQIFERDQDEKSLELQQPLIDKSDSGIDETVRILRTVNDDAEQEDDWKFQSHSFDRLPRTLRLPYERTWFQVGLSAVNLCCCQIL